MYNNWYKKSNKLYGYWITSEGKEIPVHGYQKHASILKRIEEEGGNDIGNKCLWELKLEYMDKGWISIAFDFGDMFITANQKPQESQVQKVSEILKKNIFDIKNIHVATFKDKIGKKIPVQKYKMVIPFLKGKDIIVPWIGAKSKKKQMVKSASKLTNFLKSPEKEDIKNESQRGTSASLYDVQRYVMDSYNIKVNISKTDYKIIVYIMANHALLGSVAFHKYWSFNLDQEDQSIDIYYKICDITSSVIDYFVNKEIPTSTFWPILKYKLDLLNPDDEISSNIPYVNYKRYYSNLASPDWRENLYGKRYPAYSEASYNQEIRRKGIFTD